MTTPSPNVSVKAAMPARPLQAMVPWVVAFVAVLIAYWPALVGLEGRWRVDPQYSHGYVVPLFCIFLLWHRRDLLKDSSVQGSWWGVGFLLLAALIRFGGARFYIQWFEDISIIPVIAGVALLLGGWTVFLWALPAIIFVGFMIPLPFFVEGKFAEQLQTVGCRAGTYLLQTIGYPALADGTDILIREERMGVVKACSGLGMLMTFFALSFAVAFLSKRPLLDRIIVVLSAVPIAILSNIMRITTTGILYQFTKNPSVRSFAHDFAGWFMMLFALIVLWLELKLLSWLLVPEDPKEHVARELFDKPLQPSPGRVDPKAGRNKKRSTAPGNGIPPIIEPMKSH